MFALRDGAALYESIYETSLWWLATIWIGGPLLIVAAVVTAAWIVGDLRNHFDLLRDDRTEGSYLVEASLVVVCLATLVGVTGYVLYLGARFS